MFCLNKVMLLFSILMHWFLVAGTKEFDEKIEAYKQCLQQLPAVNHATLKQLVLHLCRLELYFSLNQLCVFSLSVCNMPSVL